MPPQPLNLTNEQIVDAIRSSGFPLELRLFRAFTDAKFSITFGERVPVPDEPSGREIDLACLIAETVRYTYKDKKFDGYVRVRLLIEAKGVGPDATVVGFPVDQTHGSVARGRCYFGGAPSCSGTGGLDSSAMYWGEDGAREALEAFSRELPVCVQWANIRRGAKDKLASDHDQTWANAVEILARGAQAFDRRGTALGGQHDGISITINVPVIVCGPRGLHLYDERETDLRATDWFCLFRRFDLGDGSQTRVIDVVSEPAVPALITRSKALLADLAGWAHQRAAALHESAVEERARRVEQIKRQL